MSAILSADARHTIEEMIATLEQSISDAKAKLAESVLVGQGFCCVLQDCTMAITIAGDVYRLVPVKGSLSGVLHRTRDGAADLAARWNANLSADRQRLAVEPMHYRDLLQACIGSNERLLELLLEKLAA